MSIDSASAAEVKRSGHVERLPDRQGQRDSDGRQVGGARGQLVAADRNVDQPVTAALVGDRLAHFVGVETA